MFFAQAVKNVFVVVLIFRIPCIGIMARSAREIGRHPMLIAGHGAIGNAVAVLIEVATEFFAGFRPLFQLFGVQPFAIIERFLVSI